MFLLVASCTSNTMYKKPDDLISKKQMIDLLTDLYLSSGTTNIKNINLENKVDYTPLIYEKYKIDSNRFKRSNFYYTSRIDDYDVILEAVSNNLTALKKTNDSLNTINDSIESLKKGKPYNPPKKLNKYNKTQSFKNLKEDELERKVDDAYIK